MRAYDIRNRRLEMLAMKDFLAAAILGRIMVSSLSGGRNRLVLKLMRRRLMELNFFRRCCERRGGDGGRRVGGPN